MKYILLFSLLFIASEVLAMNNKTKHIPLARLAKNFQSYDADQLERQLKDREYLSVLFAENKIEELNNSRYLSKLLAYSGLAITGIGTSFYSLFYLSKRFIDFSSMYKNLNCDNSYSRAWEMLHYYVAFGSMSIAAIAITFTGLLGGIGLYKLPQYLPKTFAKNKQDEIENFRTFKAKVLESPFFTK